MCVCVRESEKEGERERGQKAKCNLQAYVVFTETTLQSHDSSKPPAVLPPNGWSFRNTAVTQPFDTGVESVFRIDGG